MKLKPSRPVNPHLRKIVVSFKVNSEEMRKLLAHSHGLTGGNVSEFVRYASLNFKASKKDIEK